MKKIYLAQAGLAVALCFSLRTNAAQTTPPPSTGVTQAASQSPPVVLNPSTTTAFRPVRLSPHSRRWERVTTSTNANRTIRRTNSFTEIQTGLAFLNPATQRLEESDPAFTITNGYAMAQRCQHQVIVAPTLDSTNGFVIDLQTPDGKRIRNSIAGLNLYDPQSQNSLQVSTLKDGVVGQLTASNEITWFDAFEGLQADVRIRNERAGVHQDVLLRERLSNDQLTGLGFNPDTVRLETWTAFDAPNPAITPVVAKKRATSSPPTSPGQAEIVDQNISFDVMRLVDGLSFTESDPERRIRVPKEWLQTTQGVYLVESVQYSALVPLLQSVPIKTASLNPAQKKSQMAMGRAPPRKPTATAGRPREKFEIASTMALRPTGPASYVVRATGS